MRYHVILLKTYLRKSCIQIPKYCGRSIAAKFTASTHTVLSVLHITFQDLEAYQHQLAHEKAKMCFTADFCRSHIPRSKSAIPLKRHQVAIFYSCKTWENCTVRSLLFAEIWLGENYENSNNISFFKNVFLLRILADPYVETQMGALHESGPGYSTQHYSNLEKLRLCIFSIPWDMTLRNLCTNPKIM